jgi:hypothetical protein
MVPREYVQKASNFNNQASGNPQVSSFESAAGVVATRDEGKIIDGKIIGSSPRLIGILPPCGIVLYRR